MCVTKAKTHLLNVRNLILKTRSQSAASPNFPFMGEIVLPSTLSAQQSSFHFFDYFVSPNFVEIIVFETNRYDI